MYFALLNTASFSKNCINLYSYWQCIRVSVAPHPGKHLKVSPFHFSHPDRWVIVSHCGLHVLSLMTKDVEHLFVCSLVICEVSVQVCCLFFKKYRSSGFVFLMYKISLNILSMMDGRSANIFSWSVAYLFTLLVVSFDKQKFLILMTFISFIFSTFLLWLIFFFFFGVYVIG